jgi:Nucleoporin Nup120/160
MAKPRAPFLYTETRLNLDQGHAGSTVDITLPQSTKNSSIFSNTVAAKRSVVSDIQIGADESTFAREHLATDASVYFRRDERYPRSFLWRLLDDRKALEIQSVDLSEDENEKTEALLTLVLRFPAAIRPFCIGFADPDERDALNVFAITTTNELWTLTLQKDFFVHLKTTEALTMEWCKVSEPSLFVSAKPYRMFASNSQELFVSLEDGSVVRLTRTAGDNGKSPKVNTASETNNCRIKMARKQISRRSLDLVSVSHNYMAISKAHGIRRPCPRSNCCALRGILWL